MPDFLNNLQRDINQARQTAPVDVDKLPPMPEPPPAGDNAPQKPRFVLHTAAEALEPQSPIQWIVQDILAGDSTTCWAGEGGCGKTWLLLDMAVSVVMGGKWLGHTTTPCPVLWVDEESGERRMKRRLGDVMRGLDADGNLPLFFTTLARFNLWTPDDVTTLHGLVLDTGARLVVIDALVDTMPGKDENAVKDTQPVFMALREIAAATGAAVVVIHHAGKNGDYRGSSAIRGAVDNLIKQEAKNNIWTVTSVKLRDDGGFKFAVGPCWQIGRFTLQDAVSEDDKPVFGKGEKHVLQFLSDKAGATVEAIMSAAAICSEGTARGAIYRLAERGLVTRTDGGGKGAGAVYALTATGQTASFNL